MTEYRIEYGQRETTKHGFVDGLDTGDPVDLFRTFEPTPERRFYMDDVEVDRDTFIAALDADPRLVELRQYAQPETIEGDR